MRFSSKKKIVRKERVDEQSSLKKNFLHTSNFVKTMLNLWEFVTLISISIRVFNEYYNIIIYNITLSYLINPKSENEKRRERILIAISIIKKKKFLERNEKTIEKISIRDQFRSEFSKNILIIL